MSARPLRLRNPYALYLIPGVIAFLAVVIVPFAMNIYFSLTHWQGVGSPTWAGLENYQELMKDSRFWESFRHSVAMVLAMAVIPTAVGLVVAAALFDYIGKHFGSKLASVLRACFYLPQVLPITVAGIVWSWILAPENGSLNELLKAVGLGSLQQDWLGDPNVALYSVMAVMVWVQLGFPVVIFMAGLQRVDPSLHEAAELDGTNWWQRFWHVTLPQIRPEIYVVMLWCTIAALKVFGAVYVLTKGGPADATIVPSYFSFSTFFEKTDVGYGSAIATVLTLIILALTTIGLRFQSRSEDAQ
ncbi:MULTISPECIES: carbohydrate ABC transporter permease [Streptomyces]|uniref:carbohydrate ABC transporter permease n=1 Tax=Streptomyces TaxID=1883 RepID=UPI000749C33C|nr:MULTISPECIES: sugar ABC transporter permease [Streptomyces]KUL71226.1 ABC transporter permease [Streptomyces sp. NRRL WC-3604]KUL76859.1 ABC transporter permease [Streptomyces sp. NRRL WC-3605]